MMFEKIDRRFMELMNRFDKEVSAFHAFRQLWANLASNREPCGLSVESLEKQQSARITDILNVAEQMRDHVGLKWCFTLSRDATDGLYIAKEPGGTMYLFRLQDGVMHGNSGDEGQMSDLINKGWQFDGPIRSAVFA